MYYFKAASGDVEGTPPHIKTGTNFSAKPEYIKNGSFENDLVNWTGISDNGSIATFNTITSDYHFGKKAMEIVVTDKGVTNSVKLAYKQQKVPRGNYILRFWALANRRDALMNINLLSPDGDNTCAFKIYNRFDNTQHQWQMYQYAFEVTKSPVTLEFRFNSNTTYFLDDVEVIAFNDKVHDVRSQFNWQYNQNGYGWLSGDNDNSVLLPDGSVAWIFSDSFLGIPDPHSNIIGSAPIINNVIVHEKDDQYRTIYKGTQSNPQALFSPGNGNVFWNSGGVVENNKLNVLLLEISGLDFARNVYVGTLSLPDLSIESKVLSSYHGVHPPNTIFQDGGYNYMYIGERAGTFENYTQVARVPAGTLYSASTLWEFYSNSNTWSTDYTQAKRIVAGVEAGTVVKIGENNYAMSGVPNLSNEIAVWFAQSPVGPWINKTVISYIPVEEGILPYFGHIDAGSGKNGVYTFSYSVYPFSGYVPQQLSDKGSYIPYYVKANLLQLSPFTNSRSTSYDTISKTSINIGSQASLMVQPNPVVGDIYFSLNNYSGQKINVVLSDLKGMVLHQQNIDIINENGMYKLNMNTKPKPGSYYLTVSDSKEKLGAMVIIQ